MEFVIERTSIWDNKKTPCSEAYRKTKKISDETEYFVEIESLKQLIEFVEKNGKIVITPACSHCNEPLSIEIYDDYRE